MNANLKDGGRGVSDMQGPFQGQRCAKAGLCPEMRDVLESPARPAMALRSVSVRLAGICLLLFVCIAGLANLSILDNRASAAFHGGANAGLLDWQRDDAFYVKDEADGFQRVNFVMPQSHHEQNITRLIMSDTTSTTVNVSTAEELWTALENASGGDTILLAPGDYGKLQLNVLDQEWSAFESEVTIKSMDPDNMAVFDNVRFFGVENVTFDSVHFDYTYTSGELENRQPFEFYDTHGMTIRNSHFDGDVAEGLSSAADGFGAGYGLAVREGSSWTVENNVFDTWYGAAAFGRVSGLVVADNEISDIRMDGLRFTMITDALIEGNHIHDFSRSVDANDHSDYIQFWTREGGYASTDITIRGNILDSGEGKGAQSIFMTADVPVGSGDELFYKNILIEDNVIHNAHNHGITVGATDGLTIQNNTILHNADSGDVVPYIKSTWDGSKNVLIANNIVPTIMQYESTADRVVENNLVVQTDYPEGENYVGDLFVNGLAGALAALADLQALPDGLVVQLGVGASLTRFHSATDQPVGYIANDAGRGLDLLSHGLDASHIFGPDGALDLTGAEVSWDFGDGNSGTGLTPGHTWQSAGTYHVSANVVLPDGTSVELNKTIAVQTPLAIHDDFDAGAQDLSDSVNTVTVGSEVTFEGAGDDLAARLNGGTIRYERSPDLVNNPEYTLVIDFKKDQGNELAKGDLINFSSSFGVQVMDDGLSVWFNGHDGAVRLAPASLGLTDSEWHRLAFTFSGVDGNAVLYLDGQQVAQLSGLDGLVQTGSTSHPLYLGSPSGGSFPGLIDNFQFWKGAMSAEQVKSLAVRAEDGKFVPLEGTGTVVVDDTTTTDPVDDTTTEPVDDTTTEPVDDTTTEPVDDTTTDPVDDTTTDPVDDTTTDPVDDTTTDPVDDTTTEPVDDTSGEPVDEGTTEWDFADVERTLVGSDGDDNLSGDRGDDVIDGVAGNDTLRGGNGHDILMGGDGNDGLFAGHGNDILVGGRGDDLLSGKFGDDILVGGMGSDTLDGGRGADLFVLNSVAESPVGAGRDSIVDFSQGEDRIDLSRLAVAGKADGAFTLIGTASFSKVAGELRQFDDANGIVVEGDVDGDGAADFQIAVQSPGLTLAPADFVGLSATAEAIAKSEPSLMEDTTSLDDTEEVTHAGSPVNDHLTGTGGADVMDGAEGDDTLRGKAGNDSLYGGDGDDTLYAGRGDDLLVGGAGNDLLNGGDGDDVLIGGFGQDSLTGGSGADTFVFETTIDSLPGSNNRDTIEDFSRQEGDKIDLSAIDADVNTATRDSFVFIEKAGFSGNAGELRYFVDGQGHAVVDGDTDGDAESDFQFLVADTSLLSLDDFTL